MTETVEQPATTALREALSEMRVASMRRIPLRLRILTFFRKITNPIWVFFGNLLIYAQAAAVEKWRQKNPQKSLEDLIPSGGEISFEASGKAGEILTLREWPEEWFLGQKLVVKEMGPNGESRDSNVDTILVGAFVGIRNQFPTAPSDQSGVHCGAFDVNALGSGLRWDPCYVGQSITLRVHFIKDCKFYATIFGKLDRKGIMRTGLRR